MKKFALKTLAVILFVSTAVTSCSSDNDSETIITQNEFVTAVAGPETGNLNQEISFDVTYVVDNACGSFDSFVETTSGSTKTVEVKVKYVGDECVAAPSTKTEAFKFTINTAGTYTFKFRSSAIAFITKTIVIQ
jgi:ABC-type oligopeptide transport system substrate-binding subunit